MNRINHATADAAAAQPRFRPCSGLFRRAKVLLSVVLAATGLPAMADFGDPDGRGGNAPMASPWEPTIITALSDWPYAPDPGFHNGNYFTDEFYSNPNDSNNYFAGRKVVRLDNCDIVVAALVKNPNQNQTNGYWNIGLVRYNAAGTQRVLWPNGGSYAHVGGEYIVYPKSNSASYSDVKALIVVGDSEDECPERESAAAAEPVDPLLGERLGPFRVIERIGRGGMGMVYRGEREDADFIQIVAIKLIRRGFDFDDVQARFLRERRILAKLNHPNLARFIDGGVAPDGRPWFALEFVDGKAITRWCDAEHLAVRERVRLFLDVCAAVQYAHSQLVVHRDLKPSNILVGADGSVRLLDFGIAGLLEGNDDATRAVTTLASCYALTPEYAAPEQFARTAAGVGADVYSLGVILYELVTGVLPYTLDRHDLAAAERTVRDHPPEPPT